MTKLLIIADVEGWAYDRRAHALKKYAPEDFEVDIKYICKKGSLDNLCGYDVVFNIDYSATRNIKGRMNGDCPKAKLVVSHNADHRRAVKAFREAQQFAHYVIFNNREAFRYYGSVERTCNISNGVDFDLWGVDVPPECRTNTALWTGGDGKGYPGFLDKLYDNIPSCSFDIRYIGRNGWDENRNVNRDVIWDSARMRQWYNGAKIVLCSSDTEATPNYLLEGMACGLVPVSTRVGNLMEFGKDSLNCRFADKTITGFNDAVDYVVENYEAMQANVLEDIKKWDWKDRSVLFFDLFRSLHRKVIPAPFSYSDSK